MRVSAKSLKHYLFYACNYSGWLVGRKTLLIILAISTGAIFLSVFREQDAALKLDSFIIAGKFILLNGLMALFLDQFGLTLRTALNAALERENELKNEINIRRQTEAALQQFAARLEILHGIDRSLLSARSPHEIARSALARIRQLIPCLRASVTLFDLDKNEAKFLAANFDNFVDIPDTPIHWKNTD